jgi:hypothetical protein
VSAELQARYERLLRWYPAAYRRQRGAEMLGVLMDGAAEGSRRPPLRERWALVLGGLRMRTGAAGYWRAWQSWRAALSTAAVILLILNMARAVSTMAGSDATVVPSTIAQLVVGTLAVVAVLRQYFALAVACAAVLIPLVSVGVFDGQIISIPFSGPRLYSPWLVIAFLLPLVGRDRVRVPRSLHGLSALALIPAALWVMPVTANASRASWWFLLGAAVLWALVDERPALTLGLVLLYNVAYELSRAWDAVRLGSFDLSVPREVGIAMIMPVIGITAGAFVARRRSKI